MDKTTILRHRVTKKVVVFKILRLRLGLVVVEVRLYRIFKKLLQNIFSQVKFLTYKPLYYYPLYRKIEQAKLMVRKKNNLQSEKGTLFDNFGQSRLKMSQGSL